MFVPVPGRGGDEARAIHARHRAAAVCHGSASHSQSCSSAVFFRIGVGVTHQLVGYSSRARDAASPWASPPRYAVIMYGPSTASTTTRPTPLHPLVAPRPRSQLGSVMEPIRMAVYRHLMLVWHAFGGARGARGDGSVRRRPPTVLNGVDAPKKPGRTRVDQGVDDAALSRRRAARALYVHVLLGRYSRDDLVPSHRRRCARAGARHHVQPRLEGEAARCASADVILHESDAGFAARAARPREIQGGGPAAPPSARTRDGVGNTGASPVTRAARRRRRRTAVARLVRRAVDLYVDGAVIRGSDDEVVPRSRRRAAARERISAHALERAATPRLSWWHERLLAPRARILPARLGTGVVRADFHAARLDARLAGAEVALTH